MRSAHVVEFRCRWEHRWTGPLQRSDSGDAFAFSPQTTPGRILEDSARTPLLQEATFKPLTLNEFDTQWIDNQRLNAQRALAWRPRWPRVGRTSRGRPGARARHEAIDSRRRTVEALYFVPAEGAEASTTTPFTHGACSTDRDKRRPAPQNS